MEVGIEALNVYSGQSSLSVHRLFEARNLDLERFDNLMMEKKSVGLPCEDGVTHAVNAAKPLLDRYSEEEKQRIELVITATESSTDFAKSMSTYVHKHLGLSRNCRLFELKQACYGGTAALQMAAAWIKSQASPGAKALVLASDVVMSGVPQQGTEEATRFSYAEPSAGTAGIAMVISDTPDVLSLDFGANGYFSYEVNDVCRPTVNGDAGDPDLSLLSYLDCVEGSLSSYFDRVENANFKDTFNYLVFHTPFGGMVKGAHRKAMRAFTDAKPKDIAGDFDRRVMPSLQYCVQVGGVYSATLYLALCSLLDNIPQLNEPKRVGFFSYGSGCASEFYSGVITARSQEVIKSMKVREALDNRYSLSMEEYDDLLIQTSRWGFGVNNQKVDFGGFSQIYKQKMEGKGLLVLKGVQNFNREYGWS